MLKSLVLCISWTWESFLQYKKGIEDIGFDYLYKIPANRAHYLGYIVSVTIFPNQVKFLILSRLEQKGMLIFGGGGLEKSKS